MTFAEAEQLCENLETEGFPNGRMAVLDNGILNSMRPFFYGNDHETLWSELTPNMLPIDQYWNVDEPSGDACVYASYATHPYYGPFGTTDCEEKHHFLCERPVDIIDTVTTKVLDNKEYTITTRRANYTEELNLVRSEFVPGRLELWLGYSTTDTSQYTPASYGITEDKHGASMDHWAEEQPRYPGGIIVTDQFGFDDETEVIFPLLSQASFSDQHYYVCVRDLTIVRETDTEEVPETSTSQINGLQLAGATLIVVGVLLLGFVVTASKIRKGSDSKKPNKGEILAPTV